MNDRRVTTGHMLKSEIVQPRIPRISEPPILDRRYRWTAHSERSHSNAAAVWIVLLLFVVAVAVALSACGSSTPERPKTSLSAIHASAGAEVVQSANGAMFFVGAPIADRTKIDDHGATWKWLENHTHAVRVSRVRDDYHGVFHAMVTDGGSSETLSDWCLDDAMRKDEHDTGAIYLCPHPCESASFDPLVACGRDGSGMVFDGCRWACPTPITFDVKNSATPDTR